MDYQRKRERTTVDVPVTLTTVLDSVDGRIIDLTENGAQIMGVSFPRGTKFQIEYFGQTIYAQCMWSEVDRMGVRFPFSLADGPLHDMLAMAHGTDMDRTVASTPSAGFMPAANLSGITIRRGPASFGRRLS